MSKYNILIVEDEPAMLSGLKDNLEFEGYNVDTAIEGDSGLKKILNKKIKSYGVQIPINKDIYDPILSELEGFGIIFKEKEVKYLGYNPLNA